MKILIAIVSLIIGWAIAVGSQTRTVPAIHFDDSEVSVFEVGSSGQIDVLPPVRE